MNLRQLSAFLLALLTDHPELADCSVICEDGEFEVQGAWFDDVNEVWLTPDDGIDP